MTTITDSTTATARDRFLRFAMRLDAGFSGVVGIIGLAIASRSAELAGTTAEAEYALGAVFVAYGVLVFLLSRRPSVRTAGIGVIAANVVFTVAAVVAIVADVWPLTTTGVVLTLGSAVYTLVMADLQYLGLRRLRA